MMVSQEWYQALDTDSEAYVRHCGREGLPAVWMGFGMLQRHEAEELEEWKCGSRERTMNVYLLFSVLLIECCLWRDSKANGVRGRMKVEGERIRDVSALQTAFLSDVDALLHSIVVEEEDVA